MSNTKLPLFVQEIIAILKGDEAEATGIKIQKQATNALTPQISIKEAMVYDLEEAVETAKDHLIKVRNNFGRPIEDKEVYIISLFNAQDAIEIAEEKLEDHLAEIEFLKEQLEAVKS